MNHNIAVERVDHIGIRVRDLDRALEFYRVLGFRLAQRATGDDVALTMAIVRAPVARADSVAATRSGLRPDCEITINRAFRSSSVVRNAVVTDGALAETGRRSRVSTRYLRNTPAWPELPRPHRTHKGAEPILTRWAISAMLRRLRTRIIPRSTRCSRNHPARR